MANSQYTTGKGWSIAVPIAFDEYSRMTASFVPSGSSHEWVIMPYSREDLTVYCLIWKDNNQVTSLPSDIYSRGTFSIIWISK